MLCFTNFMCSLLSMQVFITSILVQMFDDLWCPSVRFMVGISHGLELIVLGQRSITSVIRKGQ